jgi:RNA polymerase sigma-70 factor, ECF subfamily
VPHRDTRPLVPRSLEVELLEVQRLFDASVAASSAAGRAEAIRRTRGLAGRCPESEVLGLLALMLLHESRRGSRHAPDGTPVPLHAQDRRCWDAALIAEAMDLVDRALGAREVGVHTLRAAIDALHAQAREAADTDWHRIAALYDLLAEIDASPEVARERAAARAAAWPRTWPEAGMVKRTGSE